MSTSSPAVWAHVNNTPGYKRSDWYYNAVRIEHRRDNVFSQTDNAKHDMRRKQMAPGVNIHHTRFFTPHTTSLTWIAQDQLYFIFDFSNNSPANLTMYSTLVVRMPTSKTP